MAFVPVGGNPIRVSDNDQPKNVGKSIVAGLLGILSTIYLLNPGAGFIDIIPDNLPIVGNLDEAAAAALLMSCLAYFGLDLKRLFGKADQHAGADSSEKAVTGKVVDEV